MADAEWQTYQDVLDDFDMLSDFYDPKAEPFQVFNVDTSRLPKSSRGRGRPIESDSDDNYDFNPSDEEYDDSKQFDVKKELEVQEALRQACGVGYSNKVIENYWRYDTPEDESISTRSPTPERELKISEDEEKEIELSNKSIKSSSGSSPNGSLPNGSSPSVHLDENINSDGNCSMSLKSNNSNEDFETVSNSKIFRRTVPRRKCAANFSKSPDNVTPTNSTTNQNNACSSTTDSNTKTFMYDPEYIRKVTSIDYDISSSDDESIVVESREIVKKSQKLSLPSPQQKTSPNNDGKRKTRTKFKPLNDIDIIVPPLAQLGVNNEYNKIPVEKELCIATGKLKSNLNPNAKPFIFLNSSDNSSNGNQSYQLHSHTDFPKL